MKNTNNTVVVSSEVNTIVDLTASLASQKNEQVNSAKDQTIGALEAQVETLKEQISNGSKSVRITDYYGRRSLVDLEDLRMIIEHQEKTAAVEAVAEELDELKKFKRDAELREEVLRKEEYRKRESLKEDHRVDILRKDAEITNLKNEKNILKDNIEVRAHKLEMTYMDKIADKDKQIEKLNEKLNDKSEENRRAKELEKLQKSIEEQKAEIAKLQDDLSSKSIKAIFRRLFGKSVETIKNTIKVKYDSTYVDGEGWVDCKVVYIRMK